VGHVEYPNVTAALDALQPARPLGVANAFGNLMRRDVKARIVDKFDGRGNGQRDVAPLVSARERRSDFDGGVEDVDGVRSGCAI
jgi:hypothetical protein